MDDWSLPKPRLALLLEHFAAIEDVREPWRVAYPLREVLFLAVCATIANCDDYEDIVDWGEANLKFLRGFSDYHFGIPCADWLRSLMNRIDPAVFSGAFRAWVANCWPGRPELVAIDGKTSRRSHNKKTGKGPLHLTPAWSWPRRRWTRRRTRSSSSPRSRRIALVPIPPGYSPSLRRSESREPSARSSRASVPAKTSPL